MQTQSTFGEHAIRNEKYDNDIMALLIPLKIWSSGYLFKNSIISSLMHNGGVVAVPVLGNTTYSVAMRQSKMGGLRSLWVLASMIEIARPIFLMPIQST